MIGTNNISQQSQDEDCGTAERAFQGYMGVLGIFETAAIVGMAVALEGVSGTAVAGGCFPATPFVPATCYLGVATGAVVQPGAIALGVLAKKNAERTFHELKEGFVVCKVRK